MKFRSMRGPNCCDASCSARIVMENMTPATVMTAAAMPIKTWREASASPAIAHPGSDMLPFAIARSRPYVTAKSRMAAATMSAGTTHRVVRRASRRQGGSSERRPLAPRVLVLSVIAGPTYPVSIECRPVFPARLRDRCIVPRNGCQMRRRRRHELATRRYRGTRRTPGSLVAFWQPKTRPRCGRPHLPPPGEPPRPQIGRRSPGTGSSPAS